MFVAADAPWDGTEQGRTAQHAPLGGTTKYGPTKHGVYQFTTTYSGVLGAEGTWTPEFPFGSERPTGARRASNSRAQLARGRGFTPDARPTLLWRQSL